MEAKKLILPFITFALSCLMPGNMNAVGRPMEDVLRFKLEAQPEYAAGQAVNIKFTLENISSEALFVLAWQTPLEGLKGNIFKVSRNGDRIPYEGRMIKRGAPVRSEYVRIGPGESVSATIDLSTGYSLCAAGRYDVEFQGFLHDVAREGDALPRARDALKRMNIPGNAVVITIRG